MEAAFTIDSMDSLQCFHERVFFSVVEDFGSNESNVPRDGHKEGNFVVKHNVDTESDIPVLSHDFLGYIICHSGECAF